MASIRRQRLKEGCNQGRRSVSRLELTKRTRRLLKQYAAPCLKLIINLWLMTAPAPRLCHSLA